MPKIFSCAVFVAVLAVGHFLITVPVAADDAAIIAACIEAQNQAQQSTYDCIGRSSQSCMEQPGGDTTLGMSQCLSGETAIWDQMLNDEYQKLIAALSEKGATQARKAQRLWIQMRDTDCELAYIIYEGGTIATPTAASCILDRTGTRTLQLRHWRQLANFE